MARDKKIGLRLNYTRSYGNYKLQTLGRRYLKCFCEKELLRYCPALCKGLRKGQSRKLVLTQTARGIKLERAEK